MVSVVILETWFILAFMKSRAVRLTLFLLFLLALGATGYLFWLGETRMRVDGVAARDYESRARDAIRDIHALRTAQQAYVAAGQGEQFWADRVSTTLARAQQAVAHLRTAGASPDAGAALDNAAAILQDFGQMDRRVREYVRGGQHLLASDMIFADGLELTAAGLEAVQRAAAAERDLYDETREGARRRQLYALGSAAAAALLVSLLLLPAPRAPEAVAASAESAEADAETDRGMSDAEPGLSALDAEWQPTGDAPRPGMSAVEMAAMASLCTDLARLADTQALPALLERAAAALDATGIVLWIADPDGRELSPIITHGYSPAVVTRLGTILRDAENATAAAFRTSLLQTVKADAVSNGAIAAPLVAPSGCVGVMAAEVRHEGEQDPAKLAASSILAAQLAALVGPPSAKTRAEATG
jgi:hypothetical protein